MSDVQFAVISNNHWWQRPRYKLTALVPRWIAVFAGLQVLLCLFLNCDWGVALFVLVSVGVIYFPPVGRYLKAAEVQIR